MIKPIALMTCVAIGISMFNIKERSAPSIEQLAEECSMTVSEFEFISSVVEAESDRSDSLDGKTLIALTILNRVNDPRFPSTIESVLTQSCQFSTVINGRSVVGRTESSDIAVLRAVEWLEQGDAPNVLFFNCVGYNMSDICTPYGYVDGNYFMTA